MLTNKKNCPQIPQNIQEGQKPVIFDDETPNQFCKYLQSTFTELGYNDVALIVLSFSIDCPVQSMSSKAINDFKTNFPVRWIFQLHVGGDSRCKGAVECELI